MNSAIYGELCFEQKMDDGAATSPTEFNESGCPKFQEDIDDFGYVSFHVDSCTSPTDSDTVYSEGYGGDITESHDEADEFSKGRFMGETDCDSNYNSESRSSLTTLENEPCSPQSENWLDETLANLKTDCDDNTLPLIEPREEPLSLQLKINKENNNISFEDREFDFLKEKKVRRCTSLKTCKTPPGTPCAKKGVRFADALGLDLESVRHVMNMDEPPTVPSSALRDLRIELPEDVCITEKRTWSPCFAQPVASTDFLRRVFDRKVSLENVVVKENKNIVNVSGIVRVLNIAYHKTVIVRYSINKWNTYTDVNAAYVTNSNDGSTDRFSFSFNISDSYRCCQIEFAILYLVSDQTLWDSNFGCNYKLECSFVEHRNSLDKFLMSMGGSQFTPSYW